MEAPIIPIGNSKGIRIPKAVMEQCGFDGKVVMQVENGALILSKPKRRPREGWAEQLASIPNIAEEAMEDHLPDFFEDETFIEEEWTWPEDKK